MDDEMFEWYEQNWHDLRDRYIEITNEAFTEFLYEEYNNYKLGNE